MSDDDIEQRSNSYDDAMEGTLMDAAALSNIKTSTMSGYQTRTHFSGTSAEQETEINDTEPEASENEGGAAIQRTQEDIEARETIEALRRALAGDVDASSLLSSGRGVASYGSCVCSRSDRVRSCCDKLKQFLKSPKCPALSGLVSFTSICIAIVVYFAVIHGIQVQIKASLILMPNDTLWENPTGKAFLRVYYFNITNLMNVFRGDELPIVEEIGPYVYRAKENRVGLTWIYKNTSVCYTDQFVYNLDEGMSAGSDDDEIVTVNVDFMDNDDGKLPNVTAFRKHTIRSLMSNVVKRFSIQQLEKDIKVKTTTPPSSFTLSDDSPHAMHRKLNGSEKFLFCTNSGKFNFSEYYELYSWNNLRKLKYWTTDEANRIYGSDGTSFPPFVTTSTRPVVFDPRMYRTFHLEFKEETTSGGIPVYRFIIPDSEFSNGTDEKYSNDTIDRHNTTTPTPRNKSDGKPVGIEEARILGPAKKYKHVSKVTGNGYCTPDCVPSGIYSIRTIRLGHPMFYSLPHFLGADPYYRKLLHGVKPDESKHRPIYDVHQLTGKVIRQRRRHQMVMYMDLIETEFFIPLYWLEYDIRASKEVIDEIEKYRLKYTAMHFLSYFLLAVAGVCFVHVMVAAVKKCIDSYCQGRYETIQPKAPCCCHCCTPFYRRFTYFMFRIGADD